MKQAMRVGVLGTCGALVGVVGALGVTGVASSQAGSPGSSTSRPSAAVADCPTPGDLHPDRVARGAQLAAAVDGSVRLLGTGGREEGVYAGPGDSQAKHVTTEAGVGTAFVRATADGDSLVLVTSRGLQVLSKAAPSHPDLGKDGSLVWAEAMDHLVQRDADGGERTIARPEGTSHVFSPVLVGDGTIVAVAQEPIAGEPPDGTGLDNLFRYDGASGTWARLTSFTATADEWTALRTPVLLGDGTVAVVRMTGRGSGEIDEVHPEVIVVDPATGKVRPGQPLKVDTYLAGVLDGDLVYDELAPSGEWKLVSAKGERLGCGGVAVDPTFTPHHEPPATSSADGAAGGSHPVVVIRGFATEEAARRALATVDDDGRSWTVASADVEHFALAPGTWGLLWHPDVTPAAYHDAIASVKADHPDLADRIYGSVGAD